MASLRTEEIVGTASPSKCGGGKFSFCFHVTSKFFLLNIAFEKLVKIKWLYILFAVQFGLVAAGSKNIPPFHAAMIYDTIISTITGQSFHVSQEK